MLELIYLSMQNILNMKFVIFLSYLIPFLVAIGKKITLEIGFELVTTMATPTLGYQRKEYYNRGETVLAERYKLKCNDPIFLVRRANHCATISM